MISTKPTSRIPSVSLRIPGAWKTIDEVVERLPRGWTLHRQQLTPADGPPVFLDLLPSDDEFPRIFQVSARRPPRQDEMHRIRNYQSNAVISSPAGSLFAAKHLLQTGAAIIRAGGHGVFIDNGLISHGASDWLELASACGDPMAVFYAFVNVLCHENEYRSHGMHALGHRDAVICCREQPKLSLRTIEDLLRASSCDGLTWTSGDSFENSVGQEYRVEPVEDECPFDDHPMLNPYGRYRLLMPQAASRA